MSCVCVVVGWSICGAGRGGRGSLSLLSLSTTRHDGFCERGTTHSYESPEWNWLQPCVCVCVSTKRRRRGTVVDSSTAAECDNGRLVHIPWCCFYGERGWRIGSSGSTASSSSSLVRYKLWCKAWTWETFQKKNVMAPAMSAVGHRVGVHPLWILASF